MKRKLVILTVICLFLSLVCGCSRAVPKYLPGENKGDSQFVWVCGEPFGFFFTTDAFEDEWGAMKGYIEKNGEFVCFYSAFMPVGGNTAFQEGKWERATYLSADNNHRDYDFKGYGDYYKTDFYLEIRDDPINFFDGELPELRFDKMTKEAFLEQYGDNETISELLE